MNLPQRLGRRGPFIGLALFGLSSLGCSPAPAPHALGPSEPERSGAEWRDDALGVSVHTPTSVWQVRPLKEDERLSGIEIFAAEGCKALLYSRALDRRPPGQREQELEARLRRRLSEQGVQGIQVNDQGIVALGPFSAWMMRVEARDSEGHPWFARLLTTFVKRASGLYYVEVQAISNASSLVARRTCYDALMGVFTFDAEGR